ncbi:hypothetical protein DE146DRAFT_733246 [Phaeosphaeria sp. MPI-PUGE-AT-0046c]|nr:hypothetical protein DE146DRAFT_733246 [Phaeosphaeria sp. MPI-PUGE-AT-0046c]
MTDSQDYVVHDATGVEAGELAALEAQIAAVEQKSKNTHKLLDDLWHRMGLVKERGMQDIRKHTGYSSYMQPDQVGDSSEVLLLWNNTQDWDSTARRQFKDVWTVQSIAAAARAFDETSRSIMRARDRFIPLSDTSAPHDNLLTGRCRHDVMIARKTRIHNHIQALLTKEMYEAKAAFITYQRTYLDQEDRVPDSLLTRFSDADDVARQDITGEQWDKAFAAPLGPDELATISVLVQMPFFAEFDALALELDGIVEAMEDDFPEAVREAEESRRRKSRAEAAAAGAAAADRINMMIAKRMLE